MVVPKISCKECDGMYQMGNPRNGICWRRKISVFYLVGWVFFFFFFLIFAKSVFIVCRQGDGKIGEIKVPSGGDMIKLSMKGRSSFVTLFLRQKRSRVSGDLALFRVGGYLLTYSLFLVVAGVVGAFLFCWGHSIIVVAYARSFCQR